MARESKVTLDGVLYTVPALNIGQLEKVTEAFELPRGKVPYAILRIALERSDPKADLEKLSPTVEEVADAIKDILRVAGLQDKDENPTEPNLKVVKNG